MGRMIDYHYETGFSLNDETYYSEWIARILDAEGRTHKQIDYIFCGDDYLLDINKKYLKHDTYTDIITFDYSNSGELVGDVFISVDRVQENASDLKIDFQEELLRVMAHGVLHLLGYNDKTDKDKEVMREKENKAMKLFHVEQ